MLPTVVLLAAGCLVDLAIVALLARATDGRRRAPLAYAPGSAGGESSRPGRRLR